MSDGGIPTSDQHLSVVPDKVREVGGCVYELSEALKTALESASRDVDALVDGAWTGDLAAEFGDGWTDVRDGGGHIIAALAMMAEKLGVTAETYRARDEGNASVLKTSSLELP